MSTKPIYVNAAGHGAPSRAVHERIARHALLEAEIGAPAALADAAAELDAVRAKTARLVGAAPEEIAFASNTTAAWAALIDVLDLRDRRVLLAPHEWGPFVRRLGPIAEAAGARLETLPEIDLAAPDLSSWAARIDADVAAICIPAVTSVTGVRYPIDAIGALPRPAETRLLIDAAQAIGQTPIDVTQLNCDALYGTMRKWLCGPRQTAMLWVGPRWSHSASPGARPLRAADVDMGDRNAGVWLGLGVALGRALEPGVAAIAEALAERSTDLRTRLAERGFRSVTAAGAETAIVTVEIPREAKPDVAARLDAIGCVAKWAQRRRRSTPERRGGPGRDAPAPLAASLHDASGA